MGSKDPHSCVVSFELLSHALFGGVGIGGAGEGEENSGEDTGGGLSDGDIGRVSCLRVVAVGCFFTQLVTCRVQLYIITFPPFLPNTIQRPHILHSIEEVKSTFTNARVPSILLTGYLSALFPTSL